MSRLGVPMEEALYEGGIGARAALIDRGRARGPCGGSRGASGCGWIRLPAAGSKVSVQVFLMLIRPQTVGTADPWRHRLIPTCFQQNKKREQKQNFEAKRKKWEEKRLPRIPIPPLELGNGPPDPLSINRTRGRGASGRRAA